MLNIIAGKINSGKTAKICELYNQIKYGRGFVTKKIFENDVNIGQKIIDLYTGESRIFSLKIDFIPTDWIQKYRYFDYSFSQDGIKFAEEIIYNAIKDKQSPILIDEIGPLEIEKEQGLFNALGPLLASKNELFIVIRENCLEKFLVKFSINKYTLLKT